MALVVVAEPHGRVGLASELVELEVLGDGDLGAVHLHHEGRRRVRLLLDHGDVLLHAFLRRELGVEDVGRARLAFLVELEVRRAFLRPQVFDRELLAAVASYVEDSHLLHFRPQLVELDADQHRPDFAEILHLARVLQVRQLDVVVLAVLQVQLLFFLRHPPEHGHLKVELCLLLLEVWRKEGKSLHV